MTGDDHDLLIRVDTKLEGMITDLKEFSKAMASRVEKLDSDKLAKDEAMRAFREIEKKQDEHGNDIGALKSFKDNMLGRYSIIAAGFTIAISAFVSLLVKFW